METPEHCSQIFGHDRNARGGPFKWGRVNAKPIRPAHSRISSWAAKLVPRSCTASRGSTLTMNSFNIKLADICNAHSHIVIIRPKKETKKQNSLLSHNGTLHYFPNGVRQQRPHWYFQMSIGIMYLTVHPSLLSVMQASVMHKQACYCGWNWSKCLWNRSAWARMSTWARQKKISITEEAVTSTYNAIAGFVIHVRPDICLLRACISMIHGIWDSSLYVYIYIYLSTDVFLNHAWNRSRGIGTNLEHAYNKLGTFWEQAWIMSEQAWNMLLRRWTCLEWVCSKLDIGWGAYGHPSDGIQPIPWAPGGPHVIFFLRLMQSRR